MPLNRLADWLERANNHSIMKWFVLAFVALPILLSLAVSIEYTRQQACVARWADHVTARSAVSSDWINSLNAVLDDAIRKDQVAMKRDLATYEKASAALKRSPFPEAPKYQCHF